MTGPALAGAVLAGVLAAAASTASLPAYAEAGIGTTLALVWSDGQPPGAPASISVTAPAASPGMLRVEWTAPADGSTPTGYDVTAIPRDPAGATPAVVVTAADQFATDLTGLTGGTAYDVSVAARNEAGRGTPATATATPASTPAAGRLVVVSQPAPSVIFGTPSSVTVSLTTDTGAALAGERVELVSRLRPGTTWGTATSATTGADGRAVLSTRLSASADLKARHVGGTVAKTPEIAVRAVAVSTRVTAAPSATRFRPGATVIVRGSVAPGHATGSQVWLQRYVSGQWRPIAAGRMWSTTAYRIDWRASAGSYVLRVVKPADEHHAAGASPVFRVQSASETAADIARDIVNNGRITLALSHSSGMRDLATARHNGVDVANGRLARRSAYQNAPGGYTALDPRLLRALRRMGQAGSVTVSEIAGGSHARNSKHYYGRGLDISWVNGRHVGRGSGYGMVLDACRAYGASRIFHPSYDPYGGHQGHVHCEWS